jgi:hypothetical protein
VRVTSAGAAEPAVGTVLAIDAETLVLRRAGHDAASRIPVDSILKLEVSARRKSQAGRGAVIGTAAGLMPGLLLTFGDYSSDVHGDSNAAAVTVIGAAGGALVGGVIGWALKTDDWLLGDLPKPPIAVQPVRGGVALSFRLAWGRSAGARSPAD